MNQSDLSDFGRRYAAAWSSQDAASVAAFFEEAGSLQVNGAHPAIGRAAITVVAQSFMTAFPDMVVVMDETVADGATTVFRWTLTGTNRGPGGTGRFVRISGQEEWRFGPNGRIGESKGRFDEADYRRQLTA